MSHRANRSLSFERWLPQFLAIILAFTPAYAGQAPAPQDPPATQAPPTTAPQNPPATQPATQPAAAPQNPPVNPPAKPMAPLPLVRNLKVITLAGNGEMNDLERRVMAPLVVQVLDQNDRPVEGAEVVFRFPLNGASATFPGDKTSLLVRTNGTGEAAALNWMANGQVGAVEVHVTATYGNEQGETTLRMSNVTRIVEGTKIKGKQSHWYSPTWVKVALIGGAAGIVVGVILATRGGSHSTSTSNPPITITPGPPTVGSPH